MDFSVLYDFSKLPYNVEYVKNPTQSELRELTLKYVPATLKSKYGNLDKVTCNKARRAKWTYIIAPSNDADKYSGKIIEREKAEKYIAEQAAYIEKTGKLIVIDAYIGLGERAVGMQWLYAPECANQAGMQQVLSFPRDMVESKEELKKSFNPQFRLVYTPHYFPEGMPGNQAIIVDLENWITYVMGPDYFGESKKGELRMFNEYVYQKGGLVLHAGAKAVTTGNKTIAVTILGLSGTGKTTTTFSKQGALTRPIQDDMVALWPDGVCTITENGCFAKTFGLKEENEPVIYAGTLNPDSWLENVYMNEDGTFDFSKQVLTPEDVKRYRDILITTGSDSVNVDAYINKEVVLEDIIDDYGIPNDGWDFVVWTQNGRSIIPMSAIKDAADLNNVPPVHSMGILNRDEGKDAAMPGLVRFISSEQAAAYFMLGETSKTSAAGKERGKTRSPFTQPFFPRAHKLQAERFSELVKVFPDLELWLMNTGYIGGDALDEAKGEALKVKIRHSSAILEALFSGTIKWKLDPDFVYEIVDVDAIENKELLAKVPAEILNPIIFYEKNGRLEEYRVWVQKMKEERRAFLKKYQVDEKIIAVI